MRFDFSLKASRQSFRVVYVKRSSPKRSRKASDACQIFAARARIVSGSQIRLNMSRDIHGRMLAREPCPLIRAFSAERPHQNEHHRKSGEKPKMHPPFEFGLARPSPITVIDQERSKHTCERDEDQPGPAHY